MWSIFYRLKFRISPFQLPFAAPPPGTDRNEKISRQIETTIVTESNLTRCCFCSAIDLKLFHISSPPSAWAPPSEVPASVGASDNDCQLAEFMLTSGCKDKLHEETIIEGRTWTKADQTHTLCAATRSLTKRDGSCGLVADSSTMFFRSLANRDTPALRRYPYFHEEQNSKQKHGIV